MCWTKVETIIGSTVPNCVKEILTACGYNNVVSLKKNSIESILDIENHIQEFARDVIQQLDCCSHQYYQSQHVFKFLPGHRDLIISFPTVLCQNLDSDDSLIRAIEQRPAITKILCELIKH